MIQESDINFRTLAYDLNDGIFVCDPNGTFIYANLALAAIFGIERPPDIIGKNFEDLISPESRQVFMIQFRKSMEPGVNSTIITEEIIKPDGKTALIEVKPTPFIKNRVLLGIEGVVHDITERRQAENQMMYTGTHDSLTGIYNRSFFEAELKRLERGRQFPISIILVKVGGLIKLHESNDHQDRDKLIKQVAHQLFYSFRGDDIIARIGEDEFAILFPSVDENTIDEIIKRVRGNLQKINIDEIEPGLEFYIGAGTAKDGERLNSVLKLAEAIAYLEKKKNNME